MKTDTERVKQQPAPSAWSPQEILMTPKRSALIMIVRCCVLWTVFLTFTFTTSTALPAQEPPKPETQAKIREYEASPKKVNEAVNGELPLMTAVKANDYELTKWLLEHGADIDGESDGEAAINFAEDPEIVRLMMKYKPTFCCGMTAVQYGYLYSKTDQERAKWKEIAEIYTQAGVEYDQVSAVALDDFKWMNEFIQNGESSKKSERVNELLRLAISMEKLATCRSLITEHKIDINKPWDENGFENMDGMPIFFEAVADPELLKLMVDLGADVWTENIKTMVVSTMTSMDDAGNVTETQTRAKVDSIRWIANERVDGNMDLTILHHAMNSGPPRSVKYLLDSGFDPQIKAEREDERRALTPIETAAFNSKARNVDAILTHPSFMKVDEKTRQQLKNCSLHWASRISDRDGFGIFTSFMSFVEPPEGFDEKALEVYPSCYETIKTLLEHGAEINLKQNGLTPCQNIAISLSMDDGKSGDMIRYKNAACQKIMKLFLEHGVDDTLLANVAIGDEEAVEKILADRGVTKQLASNIGFNSLHLAARMGQQSIVKKLLAAGADPNAFHEDREIIAQMKMEGSTDKATEEYNVPSDETIKLTALDEALKGNHTGIVELLKANGGKRGADL